MGNSDTKADIGPISATFIYELENLVSDEEMLGLLEAALRLSFLIILLSLHTHEHGVPGGRGRVARRRGAGGVRSISISAMTVLFNSCIMHIVRKDRQSHLPTT